MFMSCFRPAYPDLNLQNVQDPPTPLASSPFQTPPAATDARQKPSTPEAEKNKKTEQKGQLKTTKRSLFVPKRPWASSSALMVEPCGASR